MLEISSCLYAEPGSSLLNERCSLTVIDLLVVDVTVSAYRDLSVLRGLQSQSSCERYEVRGVEELPDVPEDQGGQSSF
jgi:hypothetical protein